MKTGASTYSVSSNSNADKGNILKNLRSQIDPLKETGMPRSVDPLTISFEDFRKILNDFEEVFSAMVSEIDRSQSQSQSQFQGFWVDQNTKNPNIAHPAHKIDAIWLYFVFSNFTFHWRNNPPRDARDMSEKINFLKDFENKNMGFMSRILNDIEKNFNDNPNDIRSSIRDNQRFLMIQGYLQTFIRRQGELEHALGKIPVSFPESLLKISQSIVSTRTTGSASDIENEVNSALFNTLTQKSVPNNFKPKKTRPEQDYIDELTSFELDFPLNGMITIETDGTKYHTNEFGRHDMVHTFKSAVLRASDWVRVPFSPEINSVTPYTTKEMLNRLLHLLQIPQLHEFHSKYLELIKLRSKVRGELNKLQCKQWSTGRLNELEKNSLSKLAQADIQINNFVSERHVESLLREPIQMYKKSREQTIGLKNELIKSQQELDALTARVETLTLQKRESEQEKRIFNMLMRNVEEVWEDEKSRIENQIKLIKKDIETEEGRKQRHNKVASDSAQNHENRMKAQGMVDQLNGHINYLKKKIEKKQGNVDKILFADKEIHKLLEQISSAKEAIEAIEKGDKSKKEQLEDNLIALRGNLRSLLLGNYKELENKILSTLEKTERRKRNSQAEMKSNKGNIAELRKKIENLVHKLEINRAALDAMKDLSTQRGKMAPNLHVMEDISKELSKAEKEKAEKEEKMKTLCKDILPTDSLSNFIIENNKVFSFFQGLFQQQELLRQQERSERSWQPDRSRQSRPPYYDTSVGRKRGNEGDGYQDHFRRGQNPSKRPKR